MEIAEKLYQKGFISYPRTETDSFKEGTDLQSLLQTQAGHREWGAYATSLLTGGFQYPRDGGHNDGAHPPIHPIRLPDGLSGQKAQVYEYIARHFLACCSKDGKQRIRHAVTFNICIHIACIN
jgi:DNA topoisomerase-3